MKNGSLKNKKLFLLDMDGTLYLGDNLFPETLEFLEKIRLSGARYAFMTNNSSKGKADYIQKLRKMGISSTEDDFVTSVNVTCEYLSLHHKNDLIYVCGTDSFICELMENGLKVTREYSENVNCFVIGYDTELTYNKLTDACRLLGKGIPFIATNPDWVCPTEFGYIPDCGSFCDMLKRATGVQAKFIGKPEAYMPNYALKKYSVNREDAVIVGDRLYTDIKSGLNSGIETVFVLSGEGKLSDIEETGIVPDHIFNNVGEIL